MLDLIPNNNKLRNQKKKELKKEYIRIYYVK